MPDRTASALARIPKIDRLVATPDARELISRHGYRLTLEALRAATARLRAVALAGDGAALEAAGLEAAICRAAGERLADDARPSLRPAINATGVILHTGLGRAVLADGAARAMLEVATAHSLLEIDPETGERGNRLAHIVDLLRGLTGADDGLIVNNNAAAVSLAIATLAAGREVIISRGQLVEIGGSFRIPDVIRQAGARLVEVGTTNKVRASDYEAAVTPETALILRVHPSNFRIVGFTEEPSIEELVAVGQRHEIPVVDDLGSGALIDLTRYGLAGEPMVQASVQAGAMVTTFSGDKLLGGPQAGLVVGRSELLSRMKRHPLMRVLRVDKFTLAAMAATLRLYLNEEAAQEEIPTLQALTVPIERLRSRARRLRRAAATPGVRLAIEAGVSQVGGGSLPGEELPTVLVAVRSDTRSASDLAARLRRGDPPVICRIARDQVLIDVRTVRDNEIPALAKALAAAAGPERVE